MAMLGFVFLFCCGWAAAQDIRFNYLPKLISRNTRPTNGSEYPMLISHQILDTQIIQAFDAQLVMKGLSKTEDNPDLYVTYQAAVNQERQWNSYSAGGDMWGYGRWGGWGGYGGMQTTTTSSTINIGTLNLDFYDVAQKNQFVPGLLSVPH